MPDVKSISSADKYNVSGIRPDTEKWWSFGNFSLRSRPGKDQPQLTIGLRKTAEFKALINSVADGGWINLYVFEDDKGKKSTYTPKDTGRDYAPRSGELDDEIPFTFLLACAIGSIVALAPMVA